MTAVNLQFTRPAADGSLLQAGGSLVWTPTQRRIIAGSPDNVVLPVGFDVQLGSAGLQVNVADTNSAWCWRVDEKIYGLPARTIYLAVPAMPAGASVDYTDLVQVDPATLDPLEVPEPAWWAALEVGLNSATPGPPNSLAIGTVTTGAAGSSASATITGAAPAQTLSLAIPRGNTGATGPANSLAIGTVTTGAAGSSAAASITGAAPSQTLALTIPRGNTGATGPANSLAIGTVTTGAPGSSATASITGAAPSQTLALGIPQGPVGPTGPATTLEVIGTTTGEDYQYPGPQGPQGVKGDPGGIVMGTDLGTDHLDNVKTSGVYRQALAGNATTAQGYPAMAIAAGGILVVHQRDASANITHQEWLATSGSWDTRARWTRICVNGVWAEWRAYTSTRVDQTAGRAVYQWDDLNNREQLIYGDTGYRSITPDNGYVGALHLRRLGSLVSLTGTLQRPPGGSMNGQFCTIPTGFAPAYTAWIYTPVRNNGSSATFWLYRQHTNLLFSDALPANETDASQVRFDVSWTTTAAWPTVLPGTASGGSTGTIPT